MTQPHNLKTYLFNLMTNEMNIIIEKYFGKNVVFGSCNDEWLIILSSDDIDTTKTNPFSYNVAKNMYVHEIVNKMDFSVSRNFIETTYKDTSGDTQNITIEKEKYIDEYFYFVSPRAAFYYTIPDNYSGKYIKWDVNGHKKYEGTYVNGLRHSEWKYFEKGRFVIQTINYIFDKKRSLSNYRQNKNKKSEYIYDDNEKCIGWYEWDEQNRLVVEGKLKNGESHYIITKYYESSKILSISKYVNKKLSRKINFNENGDMVSLNNYNTRSIDMTNNYIDYYCMD